MNAREEIPITEEVMRFAQAVASRGSSQGLPGKGRPDQYYIRRRVLVVLSGYRGRPGLEMKKERLT